MPSVAEGKLLAIVATRLGRPFPFIAFLSSDVEFVIVEDATWNLRMNRGRAARYLSWAYFFSYLSHIYLIAKKWGPGYEEEHEEWFDEGKQLEAHDHHRSQTVEGPFCEDIFFVFIFSVVFFLLLATCETDSLVLCPLQEYVCRWRPITTRVPITIFIVTEMCGVSNLTTYERESQFSPLHPTCHMIFPTTSKYH